jgi:hypothetical protein
MKYISIQPDSIYFLWQLKLQDYNFNRLNILDKSVAVIIYENEPSKIFKYYAQEVAKQGKIVLFIKDERNINHRKYSPTIKPYGFKKLIEFYPSILNEDNIFYHDSDILFVREFDYNSIVSNNKTVIVSDTKSYLNTSYIKSKSNELFNNMCNIVGIQPELVENLDNNCGGAQYIFPKDFQYNYVMWDKIENDSVSLYNYMVETSNIYSPEYPIQAWTAEMWATLWNIWLFNNSTKIDRNMDFAFAHDSYKSLEYKNIYHNSGVTENEKNMFYKGKYIDKFPFFDNHNYVNKDSANYFYVEEMRNL